MFYYRNYMEDTKKINLELLAPARNLEAGKLAVTAGADAVYIAGPSFGARQAAGNSIDDIKKLATFAHLFGAKVYLDKIPIAPESRAMADEIGIDIITSVINGGDDYRLLYVVPLEQHEQLHKEMGDLDVIGHLCPAEEGAALVTPDGRSLEIKAQGWN